MSERVPAKSAAISLAVTCMVVWLVAAANTGPFGIWLALGGTAVVLGVAVFVLDHTAARTILQPSTRLVLVGAVAGCLMATVSYLVYPLFASFLPFITSDTARLYASFRAPPPVIAALALVPVIFGEELVWRGVVQTALVGRLGTWRGVTLTALAYAVAHAPLRSPVLIVVALLCGMAWGALRAATASLVPAVLAHLVWDVLVLLWLPLDSR